MKKEFSKLLQIWTNHERNVYLHWNPGFRRM